MYDDEWRFSLNLLLTSYLDGKCHIYDSLYLLIHYIYDEYLFLTHCAFETWVWYMLAFVQHRWHFLLAFVLACCCCCCHCARYYYQLPHYCWTWPGCGAGARSTRWTGEARGDNPALPPRLMGIQHEPGRPRTGVTLAFLKSARTSWITCSGKPIERRTAKIQRWLTESKAFSTSRRKI